MKKISALVLVAVCVLSFSFAPSEEVGSNQVIETIMSRRSIRKYKSTPVERAKLELIAKCGINAPSGMNAQPWAVRIVDSKEHIDAVTEVFKGTNPHIGKGPSFQNMFRNAPAVIFIATPKNGSGQIEAGLMGENMILAAESLGLGTCCLGGLIHFLKNDKGAEPFVKLLDIPENYELLYAIGVGYPDEKPEPRPRDASKVKFID